MSAVVASPPGHSGLLIGENERLGATFVLSLLVHGMLVLGVGFALEGAAPVLPTLDVILTQTQTPLTPEQADFLAQASNVGGGEHERSRRPRDSQPGVAPQPEPGVAPRAMRRQAQPRDRGRRQPRGQRHRNGAARPGARSCRDRRGP